MYDFVCLFQGVDLEAASLMTCLEISLASRVWEVVAAAVGVGTAGGAGRILSTLSSMFNIFLCDHKIETTMILLD